MKKIVIFLVAILLVTAMAVPALAADEFFLSGPEVLRAGDTVTITFHTGNLYNGVYGGSGTMSYDANQLTLVEYTSLLGDNWEVEFLGDHFSFTNSTKENPLTENVPIFTVEFQVHTDVPIGTMVSISARDVVLNNGEIDVPLGNTFWARYVFQPLSDNADLAALSVQGFMLSPAFAPEQQIYAVYLPNEVESLRVDARVADYRATLELPTLENIPVGRTIYEIPVTAQNGDVKVYSIAVFRAEPMLSLDPIPEETEPATEPTEAETEPTTEPTIELTTEPTTEPTTAPIKDHVSSEKTNTGMSNRTMGLLWIVSLVAAFIGGIVAPMLIWNRE